MTPKELYDMAQGDDFMSLVVPWRARGEKVRLLKSKGPYGVVMNVRPVGKGWRTTALFDRSKVRKYLKRHCPLLI